MMFLIAVFLACVAITTANDESPQDLRAKVRVLNVGEGGGIGSAVTIAPGLVLTAGHVVENGAVRLRDKGPVGRVLASLKDPNGDLALLAFPPSEAPCPCVSLAEREADRDETVWVVGYPLGIAQVITRGESQGIEYGISVPGMFGMRTEVGTRLVVTAIAAPGNSGGGVFADRHGRYQLVGILTEAGPGMPSLAVPLSTIRPFIRNYLP